MSAVAGIRFAWRPPRFYNPGTRAIPEMAMATKRRLKLLKRKLERLRQAGAAQG
ncbi:MAG: hypothetical protein IRZ06_10040 [Nevskia sp.]|nr:hypothetical protein [Nevskia sp.]